VTSLSAREEPSWLILSAKRNKSSQLKPLCRLSKLSGAQFDQHQFVKAMVTDHKEDIAKYEKEAKSKGPLADFSKDTLPTLQHHLQTAETLAKQKSNL
jgi:predicted outer membrane protein